MRFSNSEPRGRRKDAGRRSSRLPRALAGAAILGAALLVIGSCSRGPSADEQFVGLATRYLEKVRQLNPEWSTNLGDHRYDDQVSDYSPAGVRARIAFHEAYLDSMELIDPARLGPVNMVDYQIMHRRIQSELFELKEIKPHQWNPRIYQDLVGDGIYNLLAREFAPLHERLRNVAARLEKIDEVLDAARSNLQHPPEIFTRTVIAQNRGTIHLVMDGLQPYLEQAPDLKEEFVDVRARAIATLQSYGRWLEETLLPRSLGDFRLGEDRYRTKLQFSLDSNLTPAEILDAAERELDETLAQMEVVAARLYRKYFPGEKEAAPEGPELVKKVLDRLADDRPTSEDIVAKAEDSLARCTAFVRERDLVAVPDEPVEVIVMPEHQRGVWIGYCDSPGPLEENGKTFYAISPTPRDWSPEKSESFYREYNDYMLEDLTIHEAMPGHYLQIAHANAFEAPTLIRAIFSSGTFVEGWATYAEQIMADAGYGGDEVKIQQLKMRLRLIINAIIDQKIHAGSMTEQEAMDLMMERGFQEEGEAALKWRRACLTSTQLSTYFVGNLEVNRIRADYEAKQGDDFDLREFHDRLLSYGSPAPRYVRELMGL